MHRIDHGDAFAERVGKGFLTKNVLAGVGGGDGRNRVPVIGSADAHRIDVLAGQQFLKVLVALAILVVVVPVDLVDRLVQVAFVHIANGHHPAVVLAKEGLKVFATLPTHADAANGDFFRRGVRAEQAARKNERSGGGCSQKFQNAAASGGGWGIHER